MPLVMPIWPHQIMAITNRLTTKPKHKQMLLDSHGLARYIHNKNEQVIAKSFHTTAINTKDQNTIDMTDAKTGSKTYKDALVRK